MPRQRNDTPAKLAARMKSWRVSMLRNKAEHIGIVMAADRGAAEAAAVKQYGLEGERRKRLVVQEVE